MLYYFIVDSKMGCCNKLILVNKQNLIQENSREYFNIFSPTTLYITYIQNSRYFKNVKSSISIAIIRFKCVLRDKITDYLKIYL